jgi:hypothetical protein
MLVFHWARLPASASLTPKTAGWNPTLEINSSPWAGPRVGVDTGRMCLEIPGRMNDPVWLA